MAWMCSSIVVSECLYNWSFYLVQPVDYTPIMTVKWFCKLLITDHACNVIDVVLFLKKYVTYLKTYLVLFSKMPYIFIPYTWYI
jgi:hypothetical protein